MSFSIEHLLTGIIIAGALAFAGRSLFVKVRSMSKTGGCEDECGCSGVARGKESSD